MRLPITTLLLLLLLVSIPGLSFATPSSSDDLGSSDSTSTSTSTKTSSGDSDEDLGDEILVAIYSLGGLLDFGGGGGGGGSTSGGTAESDLQLPPTGSMDGDGNLSSPVPEPTGALLFGFGILAVAARRPRTD